ncbi:MAG: NAD(P)H-hydrate dehydratase [Selenomonadaceae bacterium]|nr:NAD(P)H-hydrate dehydratase [Selenomonadaceae bacterium]
MKLALVKEMRDIDRKAIDEYGVPELSLMENAGYQAYLAMEELLGGVAGKDICVLAGSGNNGGDALAAARHLMNHGAKVKIFFAGNIEHCTPSTLTQQAIIAKMEPEIQTLKGERSLDRLQVVLRRFCDGVLDGLMGTGFAGSMRADMQKLIRVVNDAHKPVVAIDIPSGVNADTGEVKEAAIEATVTITLGLPKAGHFFCPGAEHTGKLLVDDIGLPTALLNHEEIKQYLLDEQLATGLIPPRPLAAHKGTCGKVLVIAGSPGLTGAGALASMAALRSGGGVATLAVPESLHPLMEVKLTEVMTAPIPEVAPGIMGGDRAVGSILELADSHDTFLIGPGLGRNPETKEMIRALLPHLRGQVIMDADAIYAMQGKRTKLRELKKIPVLTPHLGEMAAFLETEVPILKASLLSMTRDTAMKCNAIFVVKSECTLVAFPDGEVFFNTKGNPGMATAGSGDVLAGTLAGLAKEVPGKAAVLAGVYMHSLAGDLAAEKYGEGLTAGDMVNCLPLARMKMK